MRLPLGSFEGNARRAIDLHEGDELNEAAFKKLILAAAGLNKGKTLAMCRNIKTLFNFSPPVTDHEVHDACLQFVRKITGFNKPSHHNEAAFNAAVDEIAGLSKRLLRSLETTATPKSREAEAAKAKARSASRFNRP